MYILLHIIVLNATRRHMYLFGNLCKVQDYSNNIITVEIAKLLTLNKLPVLILFDIYMYYCNTSTSGCRKFIDTSMYFNTRSSMLMRRVEPAEYWVRLFGRCQFIFCWLENHSQQQMHFDIWHIILPSTFLDLIFDLFDGIPSFQLSSYRDLSEFRLHIYFLPQYVFDWDECCANGIWWMMSSENDDVCSLESSV
jgi:hypothetical protein